MWQVRASNRDSLKTVRLSAFSHAVGLLDSSLYAVPPFLLGGLSLSYLHEIIHVLFLYIRSLLVMYVVDAVSLLKWSFHFLNVFFIDMLLILCVLLCDIFCVLFKKSSPTSRS